MNYSTDLPPCFTNWNEFYTYVATKKRADSDDVYVTYKEKASVKNFDKPVEFITRLYSYTLVKDNTFKELRIKTIIQGFTSKQYQWLIEGIAAIRGFGRVSLYDDLLEDLRELYKNTCKDEDKKQWNKYEPI